MDSPRNVKACVYSYRCFGNKHRFLAQKDSIPRFRGEHSKATSEGLYLQGRCQKRGENRIDLLA